MLSESVDVLAAQVREGLSFKPPSSLSEEERDLRTAFAIAQAADALDSLVGYAKRAEELEAQVASLRDAQERRADV